jgi:hypothetical protein
MQVIELSNYNTFNTLLAKYENIDQRVFIYITSKANKEGIHWCFSCKSAEPKILAKLEAVPDSIVIMCRVDKVDTPEWKFYEQHPLIKLQCVPAVFEIGVMDGDVYENYIPLEPKDGFFTDAEVCEFLTEE